MSKGRVWVVGLAKPWPGKNPTWHFPRVPTDADLAAIAKERSLSPKTGLVTVGPFPEAWLAAKPEDRKKIKLS
jgi:hypothetical protein